jgi:uncharacterized protein (TIGR02145 family)
MKNIIYTALAIFIIASCDKKEEKEAQIETLSATEITDTKATLWGKITEQGTSGVKEYGIVIGENRIPHTITRADSFGVQLTDLREGQTYLYVAYVIENNNREQYGIERTFTTLRPANFGALQQTNLRTATSLTISFSGVENLKEWGVHYAADAPTESSPSVKSTTENTLTITELQPNTTYRILPFATDNNDLRIVQSVFEATTLCAAPQLEIVSVTGVSPTEQKVVFKITDTGGGVITVCRLGYAEAGATTWTNVNVPYTEGNMEASMTGLKPATDYLVFAHAANRDANAQSDTIKFTTLGSVPTLAKPTVNAETSYRVNMTGGKVTNDGLLTVTEYGFSWSTTPNGTKTYMPVTAGSKDDFDYTSYDLLAGTTYYVRAYAKNQVGTGYSEEVQITTPAVVYDYITDRWDNNVSYRTVQIGNQTWMADDLRNNWGGGSLTFSGATIRDNRTVACPTGWSVPSVTDWNELIAETGGIYIAPTTLRVQNEACSYATNSTGFSLIPSITTGNGRNQYWTSDTYYNPHANNMAWGFYMLYMYNEFPTSGISGTDLYRTYSDFLPVRCIKDN